MNVKQLEILDKATNQHDKELMRKHFEEYDKRMKPIYTLMWIATIFTVIGCFGIQFNEYFILALIPVPFLIVPAMLLNLKGVGLY